MGEKQRYIFFYDCQIKKALELGIFYKKDNKIYWDGREVVSLSVRRVKDE